MQTQTTLFDGSYGDATRVPARDERRSDVRELAPVSAATRAGTAEASDRERLVALWEANGYGDAPPNCMGEYIDALEEALR